MNRSGGEIKLVHLVIKRERGRSSLNLAELWEYRELLVFFAWRDILVRYKQTTLGILWAVIRPLMTMLVFTLLFGHIAGLPSEGIPYPLLTFSALLAWQLFSTAFTESSGSVLGNSPMISRVYFPRLILPMSAVVGALVDFGISFVLFLLMLAYYRVPLHFSILWLPLFIVLCFLTSLAAGIWCSALVVRFRDLRHVVPFIVQLGLYVSPVGFSSSVVPEKYRVLYALNPLVGIIDGFRWSLFGGTVPLHLPSVFFSFLIVLLILITGAFYFRTVERTIADVL